MHSLTKVLLFELKSLLIGSLHLPALEGKWETVSLSGPKGSSYQLLDMITTKPLQ